MMPPAWPLAILLYARTCPLPAEGKPAPITSPEVKLFFRAVQPWVDAKRMRRLRHEFAWLNVIETSAFIRFLKANHHAVGNGLFKDHTPALLEYLGP